MTEAARALADQIMRDWPCCAHQKRDAIVAALRAPLTGTQEFDLDRENMGEILRLFKDNYLSPDEAIKGFVESLRIPPAPMPERDGMRAALKRELQISSPYDHRSWISIIAALERVALAPPDDSAALSRAEK